MNQGIRLHLFILFLYLQGWHQIVTGQILHATYANPIHFYEKCTPYQGPIEKSTRITAWRGERISSAFLLWSEGHPEAGIEIRVTELIGTGDTLYSENILLRNVDYVRADQESKPCGDHMNRDPGRYVELGDILTTQLPDSLEANCPTIFWLSIDVPDTITPGLYSGSVQVYREGSLAEDLTISLHVSDLRLPPVSEWKFHLDLWQYPTAVVDRFNETHPGSEIAYWDADHYALLTKMYQPLAEMGQNAITAHIKEGALGSPSMIQWIMNPDGSIEFDFTEFDQFVRTMTSWGISKQINCHSPIGWNQNQIICRDAESGNKFEIEAPIGSELYSHLWNQFLDEFRNHQVEQGWFNRTVLFLDEVEPGLLDWIIKFIHAHDPAWKIGLAAFEVPPDSVRIHLHDLSLMIGVEWPGESLEKPENLTFYTSCNPPHPNNFVARDADPYENLWMGWFAALNGYNGFLRWAFDNWTLTDPANQQVGGFTSGDFFFLYRTSNDLNMNFNSSVRMELIREGIEDHEKILLLKKFLQDPLSAEQGNHFSQLTETLEEFTWKSWEPHELGMKLESARRLLDEITASLK